MEWFFILKWIATTRSVLTLKTNLAPASRWMLASNNKLTWERWKRWTLASLHQWQSPSRCTSSCNSVATFPPIWKHSFLPHLFILQTIFPVIAQWNADFNWLLTSLERVKESKFKQIIKLFKQIRHTKLSIKSATELLIFFCTRL